MKIKLSLFFLFFCSSLQSISLEDTRIQRHSLINYEGLASAVVGSVNTISGDYVDSEIDLYLPGAEPFIIQRNYSSADFYAETNCKGWNLNHYAKAAEKTTFTDNTVRANHTRLVVKNGSGSVIDYEARNKYNLKINSDLWKKGLTNGGGGIPSGKTNLNNNVCFKEYEHWFLKTGSADLFEFTKKNEDFLFLLSHTKSNGFKYAYEYDKDCNLSKIDLKSRKNRNLASIAFTNSSEFADFTLPSGKKVRWNYKKLEDQANAAPFISSVISDFAPQIKYKYEKFSVPNRPYHSHRIIEKSLPNHRKTKIQYYKVGEAKIRHSAEFPVARVKEILKPLGPSGEFMPAYSFKYEKNKKHPRKQITKVRDAMGRVSSYYHSDANLDAVAEYTEGGCREYRKKITHFGKTGSFYKRGHLVGYGIYDTRANFCRIFNQYIYDNVGNVTKLTLHGNLSGGNFMPVVFDSFGIPERNGVETYEKCCQYSDDGFNNLLEEDDGRKKVSYCYLPGTSVCQCKFIYVKDKIVQRTFFEYDDNGFLIKEINDDGSSLKPSDFTDVTERHIKQIIPTEAIPFGLPEKINFFAYDFLTGQEVFHKGVLNTYSKDGQLLVSWTCNNKREFVQSKRFGYNWMGDCIEEIDEMGHAIYRAYDDNRNLISEEGPIKGFKKTFTYDFCNRLIKETVSFDNQELSRNFFYDKCGQKIGETDHFGNQTDYVYDDMGRLIKTILPSICDSRGLSFRPETSTEYDVLDAPIKRVNALGGVTHLLNTVRNSVYYQKNPDGTEERNEYHIDGTLVKSIDRFGNTLLIESDYLARPTKTTLINAEGKILKQNAKKYNAFHLTSETDVNGVETLYFYDFAGRLIKKVKDEFVEKYAYDSFNRLYKTIAYASKNEALCRIKEYDLLNRVIEERIEDLEGKIFTKKSFVLDALGRNVKQITYGENGTEVLETVYNGLGEISKVITPDGQITHTHYNYHYQNAEGQKCLLVTIVDAMGNLIKIEKNALGKDALTERVNVMGDKLHRRESFYDAMGNEVKTIETSFQGGIKKVTKERFYDLSGKLIQVIESSEKDPKTTQVVFNNLGLKEFVLKPSGVLLNYSYDELGRVQEVKSTDETIHFLFEYDLNDNPIVVSDLITGMKTCREYDRYNRLIHETLGNGLSLGFQYDFLGQMTRIVLPDGTLVSYNYEGGRLKEALKEGSYRYEALKYDLAGRLLKSNTEGFFEIEKSYDLRGRLIQIDSPFWSEKIVYDAASNVTGRSIKDPGGSYNECFSYDDLYQLTKEKGTSSHNYSYDAFQNRLEKDGEAYEINEHNQILAKGASLYRYDDDGNLTSYGTGLNQKRFTYDALGRLTHFEDDQTSVDYTYDPFNRRLTKSTINSEGEIKVEKYFYVKDNEIGSTNLKNEIKTFRLLTQGLAAEIGASALIEIDGKPYLPIHDHNGCLTCLVDRSGETQYTRYSAFGENTRAPLTPWGFSSKRLDPETGFIFFGKRYYNPADGRWITKDPLGECDGPNLYAYVKNQPLSLFDAYGYHSIYTPPIIQLSQYFYEMVMENKNQGYYAYEKRLAENAGSAEEIDRIYSKSGLVGAAATGKRVVTFVNGMDNTYKEAEESAEYLSSLIGNHPVRFTHNATHNKFRDFYECCLGHAGIRTEPVKRIHEDWDSAFETLLPDEPHLHYCHSQGVIHTANALETYPKDLRDRIYVVAIAPGKFIDRSLCADVVHYYASPARRDLVPCFDIIGHCRAVQQGTCRPLESITPGLQDHSFQNETYKEVIMQSGKDFFANGRL